MVLDLPTPTSFVRLHAFNTGRISLKPSWYFTPADKDVPALPKEMSVPSYGFLIEHEEDGGRKRRVVFDLGLRERLDSHALSIRMAIKLIPGLVKSYEAGASLITQLSSMGVSLDSIETVVWSHFHLDHIGDTSLFPPSTSLLVGPNALKEIQPGFPKQPTSQVLDKDTAGRKVTEVQFDGEIAGFRSHDYFGDGSLYLLDTPGHCIGHISALTYVGHGSFVLLAGDTIHHPSILRPNPSCPLNGRDKPLSKVASWWAPPGMPRSVHADPKVYMKTVAKLLEFEQDDRVLVWASHDVQLEGRLGEVNGEEVKDIKVKERWRFLELWEGRIEGEQTSAS
ncbi:Metallo-hydrolase/oxidoreductase [Atractiella rhizophila]|nr:Metallo-hydrolase/oxidoreductase [Atractiella rhizophila]